MRRILSVGLLAVAGLLLQAGAASAQGVTTAAISGRVVGASGEPLTGATINALHQPSGTTYQAVTRADGRYTLPGMRVGGPYRVTVTYIGQQNEVREGVMLNLGVATNLDFTMSDAAVRIAGIDVTAQRDAIMSSERTGAATSVSREVIENMPTITRRIEDLARLTPQYSGAGFGFSFAGQDNRLNNMTVDGSYFNNSFGLAGQPGDRTGVAPISLDAIEQVQVNVAPYDVRHGNFVGAGVNTVTRSGTNEFRGSLYHQFRNQDLVGTKAKTADFNPGTFDFSQIGGWLSGPIVQNKLFFFASFENEGTEQPGTTFRVFDPAKGVGGSITRVRASSLDSLANFLRTNFDYDPGAYQDYPFETPGTRFLGKIDYNLNTRNKLSLRYTHLDSKTDVLASNSSSLGFGTRRSNTTGLNFQNSNYQILENIRSLVGEWNAMIGSNMSNNLIVGYTYQDESRDSRGTMFPFVDILEAPGPSVYTSFGFEPFTPNNELRYKSLQFQNNFSIFGERHTLTFGASAERYKSENVFFDGSQSVYIYNSLADFYADANDFLANPNRTTSPVTLRRFQVRYANIPGMTKPVQPLEVFYAGIYGQDEFQVNDKLKLTAGLRLDVPKFGDTGFTNPNADALTFRDEDGNPVKYASGKLPDPKFLFSPRLGFNFDPKGDRSTQIRGGTGIFTGRPAYVWISNQIGNTGMLTGFIDESNTRNRPFHPDPNHYKPAQVTGAPASSYALAVTDPDFKFPQLWRTNLAVDQRLPWGLVGTAEFLYSKDINGVYYINANLAEPNAQFSGADDRPRWQSQQGTNVTRIHQNVSSAIVLKNQNVGFSWNAAGSLEKSFDGGFFAKAAYSYGVSKNTVDPGSIAVGSWTNNAHPGDPNNPGVGYAATSPGHRFFVAASYRAEWFRFGATSISLFAEGRNNGSTSYVFAGDLNGDGTSGNDLLYIPRDASEMNFQQYTQNEVKSASGEVLTPARTFTAEEQATAWGAFIDQDPYLSKNRGEYAERNAVFIPLVWRADLSVTQDLFTNIRGKRNSVQVRADILNFTNFLNSDWGVGQRLVTNQPLTSPGVDAQGRAIYRLRNINPTGKKHELISKSFEQTAGTTDVYRIQIGLRYTFN